MPALGARGDGCLYRLAGTGKATSRRNASAPFQAHLVAFASEALLDACQAVRAGSVALEPLRLARPAAVVEAIAWGRHAAKRKGGQADGQTGERVKGKGQGGRSGRRPLLSLYGEGLRIRNSGRRLATGMTRMRDARCTMHDAREEANVDASVLLRR